MSKADDEALEKSYRASLGALGVGQSMGRTVNLATVWGACATEKGRQFRQMSTDLSDFFPMIFCIEESVTADGNVTGHKGRQGTRHQAGIPTLRNCGSKIIDQPRDRQSKAILAKQSRKSSAKHR